MMSSICRNLSLQYWRHSSAKKVAFTAINRCSIREFSCIGSFASIHLGSICNTIDFDIATQLKHTTNQKRFMGIRTKAKNRKPRKAKSKASSVDALINEHLITELLNSHNATAEDVQVRLIIDQARDEKPLIEVMSLTDAINVSSEEDSDLVGINLNQEIPVVKCVDYNKFLYQQSKSSSGGSGSSGGNKPTKQFSFKAGIDDNDLERKAQNMLKYLIKGHACQVTITSNRRNLLDDKDIIESTLDRLKEIIGDDGSPQGKIKKNEYGNRGNLLFQPNSKKNKSKA